MMDYASAAGHILRRGLEKGDGNIAYTLPGWAWLVVLADAVIFLPVLIFVGYTLGTIYPTLAMIENPNPPAYDPVPLNEEPETGAEGDAAAAENPALDNSPTPVTSSLRRVDRLIRSVGGWRSNFRGFGLAVVVVIATAVLTAVFSAIPFVGTLIGTLLASLALVHLNTAWVHIVISAPSSHPFWRRTLPFRKVFEATCFPVLLAWGASMVANYVPLLVGMALGIQVWDPKKPGEVPAYDSSDAWKAIVVFVLALVLAVFLVIPASVVLVRVQASLLPPEEDTIIPFDRSFDGTVEPAIVGGKGYVTMANAWKTFSRASWIRLVKLYVKVTLVAFLAYVVMLAVLVPELIFMSKKTTKD